MGDFHGLFQLSAGVCVDLRVRAGGGTLLIARVGEQAGGSPKKFFARALLLFFQHVGDGIEGFVRFCESRALGCDIAVMETIIVDADLLHEVEKHAGAVLGVGHRVRAIVPWMGGGTGTEWIRSIAAHCVPIRATEAEPFAHGLARDDFRRVVVFE